MSKENYGSAPLAKGAAPSAPPSCVVILGAAATLSATLLGGGGAVVPLEATVRGCGYVLSPLLFLGSCAWSTYTSWALLRVSLLTDGDSYESIAGITLGALNSAIVRLFIIINAFGICVALQGLFVDLFAPKRLPRAVMVALSGIVMLPITALVRRVDRLAPLSIITSFTAVVMLGFVMGLAATSDVPAPGLTPGPTGSKPISTCLDAFSTIVIGFVVQFNVLPVYQTLPQGEHAHASMMTALQLGMGLTFFVCATRWPAVALAHLILPFAPPFAPPVAARHAALC